MVNLALVIDEIIKQSDILSIYDVMVSLILARQDFPDAGRTAANNIAGAATLHNTVRDSIGTDPGDEWARALELVLFWHYEGLMSSGAFSDE